MNPARMKKVRKQPPARVVRDAIGAPCQSNCRRATFAPSNMVNTLLTAIVRSRESPFG